jgi:hypothetical protein
MSMSYFSPSLATNISWTGAYSVLDPNNLANVANQNKALYLDGTNNLALASNGIRQPVMTDANGLIPTSLIPASFDDIREYPSFSNFPPVGDDTNGILYYAVDTGFFYKWNVGTLTYINISTINFYNKTQVDGFLATKYTKSGDTMSGTVDMATNNIINGGIFNCTNMNATSLSSNGYYNNLGVQYIGFATHIDALKNIHMNSHNITGAGAITATTSNLGTLGSNVNLGARDLTGGGLITCSNITCGDVAVTNLYDIGGVSYVNLSSNVLTMSKPIAMGNNAISGVSTLGATTVNTTNLSGHTLSGAVNANSQNISSVGTLGATTVNTTNLSGHTLSGAVNANNQNISSVAILGASNVNAVSIGVTNLYDLVGNQYAVLNANVMSMTKPLNMNTQTISGGVLGAMTNNGVSVQYASQLLASATIATFSSGLVTLNLGTAPAFVTNPLWFTGCSVFAQWLTADDWRSIPEFGPTQSDPTVGTVANFNIRYDSSTRALTVVIPDINRLVPFNNSGTVTAKLYYNLN